MKNLKERYKKWKDWKKYNRNSWLHKICVLFGIITSPTFEVWHY